MDVTRREGVAYSHSQHHYDPMIKAEKEKTNSETSDKAVAADASYSVQKLRKRWEVVLLGIEGNRRKGNQS